MKKIYVGMYTYIHNSKYELKNHFTLKVNHKEHEVVHKEHYVFVSLVRSLRTLW
jgi:hypothetical protein